MTSISLLNIFRKLKPSFDNVYEEDENEESHGINQEDDESEESENEETENEGDEKLDDDQNSDDTSDSDGYNDSEPETNVTELQ